MIAGRVQRESPRAGVSLALRVASGLLAVTVGSCFVTGTLAAEPGTNGSLAGSERDALSALSALLASPALDTAASSSIGVAPQTSFAPLNAVDADGQSQPFWTPGRVFRHMSAVLLVFAFVILLLVLRGLIQRRWGLKLEKSERKYRAMHENMANAQGMLQLVRNEQGDPVDFQYIEINRAYADLFQLDSPSDLEGRGLNEYCESIDSGAGKQLQTDQNWLEDLTTCVEQQKTLRCETFARGIGRWLSIVTYPISFDRAGVLIDDIDHRKQTEHQLEQVRVNMSMAENMARMGYWRIDFLNKTFSGSQVVHELLGTKYPSELSLVDLVNRVHPADQRKFQDELKKLEKGELYELEYRVLVPSGKDDGGEETRYIRSEGQIAFTRGRSSQDSGSLGSSGSGTSGLVASGSTAWGSVASDSIISGSGSQGRAAAHGLEVHAVGFIQDVTELRRAEKALQASQQQLTLAVRGANMGLWDFDCEQGSGVVNETFFEMLGYHNRKTDNYLISELLDMVHPDDADRVWSTLMEFFEGRHGGYRQEVRLKSVMGDWRWVLMTGDITRRDHNGQARRVVGMNIDIDDMKRLQLQLGESEKWFKALLGHTIDWEYCLLPGDDGSHLQIAFMTPSCEVLTGYPAQTFIDNPAMLVNIVHPDDREAFAASQAECCVADALTREDGSAISTGVPNSESGLPSDSSDSITVRIITRDGETRFVEHFCRPVFGPKGEYLGRRVSNRDVTSQRQVEDDLKEHVDQLDQTQRCLRIVSDNISDGVILLDDLGQQVLWCNTTASQIAGTTPMNMIGQSFSDLSQLCGVEPGSWPIQAAMSGHSAQQTRYTAPDGTIYDVVVEPVEQDKPASLNTASQGTASQGTASQGTASQGTIAGVVVTFHDISEQKRLERQLRDECERAEADSMVKGDILTRMSREQATQGQGDLLSSLLGSADLLGSDRIDDVADCADTLRSSSQTLLGILSDIVDYSRIESGTITIETLPLSCRRIAEDVITLHKSRAEKKNLRLLLDFDGSAPSYARGDEARIRQVLNKLVAGAIQHTEQGSVTLSVCRPDLQGSQHAPTEFIVTDTGPGLPEQQRRAIFESSDDSSTAEATTRSTPQSSFGLGVCRRLAQIMDGSLRCEDRPGGGTFLTFSVPLAELAETDLESATLAEANVVGEDDEAGERDRTIGAYVMLADDSDINRRMFGLFFKKVFGCKLDMAENGREAIALAEKNDYDLIFMDCHMPEVDGLEATQEIRRRAKESDRPRVPIIALTADTLPEMQRRCREVGMDDFAAKPFKLSQLEEVVRRNLVVEESDVAENR